MYCRISPQGVYFKRKSGMLRLKERECYTCAVVPVMILPGLEIDLKTVFGENEEAD